MSIIKNKTNILKLMALVVCIVVSMGVFTYSKNHTYQASATKSVNELDKQKSQNNSAIKELEETIASLEGNKEEQEAYQQQLAEKIKLQNDNIDILMSQIEDINMQIEDKQIEIINLEEEIGLQEVKIAEGLEKFKLRIRAMYISGNDSLASALVGATDFYDMLTKVELMSRVAKYDNELVEALVAELNEYNQNVEILNSQKAELEVSMSELTIKKDEVQVALDALNADMQKTQSEINRIQLEREIALRNKEEIEAENAAIEAEQAAILAEIARQQEAARKAEEARKAAEANQNKPSSLGNTGGSKYTGGPLKWPVPGFYGVSSEFGSRWGKWHGGIDIAGGGISGAAIVAAESGYVGTVSQTCSHNYSKSYSCGCGGGYGNYLTINHGGGLTTLYGHASSVIVSSGQYVERGQVIGYVGSTGFSTGFHLHFEVIENGSRNNPRNYLY